MYELEGESITKRKHRNIRPHYFPSSPPLHQLNPHQWSKYFIRSIPTNAWEKGKGASSLCLKYMLKYMVDMLNKLIITVTNLEVGLFLTQLDIIIKFSYSNNSATLSTPLRKDGKVKFYCNQNLGYINTFKTSLTFFYK